MYRRTRRCRWRMRHQPVIIASEKSTNVMTDAQRLHLTTRPPKSPVHLDSIPTTAFMEGGGQGPCARATTASRSSGAISRFV